MPFLPPTSSVTALKALWDRKVDVACIQETWWKGSCCKFYVAKGKRYKQFWMGGEERSDGVGIFVAQKWVESVCVCVFLLQLLLKRNLGLMDWITARYPSCHQRVSVKALKVIQSTSLNQWPGLIFYTPGRVIAPFTTAIWCHYQSICSTLCYRITSHFCMHKQLSYDPYMVTGNAC